MGWDGIFNSLPAIPRNIPAKAWQMGYPTENPNSYLFKGMVSRGGLPIPYPNPYLSGHYESFLILLIFVPFSCRRFFKHVIKSRARKRARASDLRNG